MNAVLPTTHNLEHSIMTKYSLYLAMGLLLLFAQGRALLAQPPFTDPFGGTGDTAELPALDAVGSDEPAESQPQVAENDPLVLSLRAANPSTAEALTRAVKLLINIGRADEAAKYLQLLADANLEPASLTSLQQRFGSGLFVRLIRHAELQPAGASFGNAVLTAATEYARSPERLRSLIARLNDPADEVRYAAIVDLRLGGEEAAAAMINQLAASGNQAEHAGIRVGLVQMGRSAVQPLIAALAADVPLRVQALVILGRLKARTAIPYLLPPAHSQLSHSPLSHSPLSDSQERQAARYALRNTLGRLPSQWSAERYLHRRALELLAAQPPSSGPEGESTLWRWEPERKEVIGEAVTAQQAALHEAHRIAQELTLLATENVEYRQLHLLTMLESAKALGGLGRPLATADRTSYDAAVRAGTEALESVLITAMRGQHLPAAIAAAEVLGDIGDEGLLGHSQGALPPLVQAVKHADRRLRFAATMSILKLDPQRPFAGASFIPNTLSYFLSSFGARRVLVVHPRVAQAQTLVGLLAELGFEADSTTNGGSAIQLAVRNADYEFVLVSDAIDRPDVHELIQQLRRHPASANLPIGLMARQTTFERMKQLTATDELSETFPRPHNPTAVRLVAQRLLVRGEQYRVPFPERAQQAAAAMKQLIRLAQHSRRYEFYDLYRQQPVLEDTLLYSEQSALAAQVLGLLATPSAQQTLVTVASQSARPLTERQAAAAAFTAAVQRRGLLLSKSDILLQYDRYNRSATQDRATQQVLGSVLDAIEGPTRGPAPGEQDTGAE